MEKRNSTQNYLHLNHRKNLLLRKFPQYEGEFNRRPIPRDAIGWFLALLIPIIAIADHEDNKIFDLSFVNMITIDWIAMTIAVVISALLLLVIIIFEKPFWSLRSKWIQLIEATEIVTVIDPEKDIITTVDDFLLELGFGREEILDIAQYGNMFNEETGLGIVNSLIRDLNTRISRFLYISSWFGWETLELLKERNETRNYRLARNFSLTLFFSCMIFLISTNLLVQLTGLLILLILGMYFLIQLVGNVLICPDTAFSIPVEPMTPNVQ